MPINSFSVARMRNVQKDTFLDSCTIDTYTSGSNSYREIVKTWTSGSVISCGYKSNIGNKSYGENETRLKYSAIVRIAETVTVTSNDKVTITKISGSTITPIQYKVDSVETGHGIKILGCNSVDV